VVKPCHLTVWFIGTALLCGTCQSNLQGSLSCSDLQAVQQRLNSTNDCLVCLQCVARCHSQEVRKPLTEQTLEPKH
jgi:hypothetical protein